MPKTQAYNAYNDLLISYVEQLIYSIVIIQLLVLHWFCKDTVNESFVFLVAISCKKSIIITYLFTFFFSVSGTYLQPL
jgi:hypothetical protein